MNDLITSIIRTIVPTLVGAIAFALANAGIDVDTDIWVAALTSLFVGVYYAAARWLELRYPQAGWLLGSPKAPTY